jgi:hypothetical protein
MSQDYFVYKAGIDKEDLYLYKGTVVDIFENTINLKISRLVLLNYYRRSEPYTVAEINYIISINPTIEKLSSMNNDEERYNFVESNWKNIIRMYLSNLHQKDIIMKYIGVVDTSYCYRNVKKPLNTTSFMAEDYFANNYPELNFISVYSGYKVSDFLESYIISKQQLG